MNFHQIKVLRNGCRLAKVRRSELCKIGRINRIRDLEDDRFIDCLTWLVNIKRGEIEWPPQKSNESGTE